MEILQIVGYVILAIAVIIGGVIAYAMNSMCSSVVSSFERAITRR